ncbi:MAG: hypothetical protein IJZ96_11540 [Lachnospiraceae bacterium]|nr:hypothetical protein [Lachnospiraceae bacterium]MBQ8318236.1 hypothetical protein [Lachnospiraceae bacterium]
MSKKKKDSGIAGLLLLFGWLVFLLLVLVFYFYFMDKIDFNKILGRDTTTEAEQGPISDNPEQYDTKYSYQTNANLDINSLMIEYYAALAVCDQNKLVSLVTDPSVYNDMTPYEQKSQIITHYSNINCYTVPGLTEDSTILYVTCNINIAGVESAPMNISQFYIVKTAEGYKINNGALDEATTNHIAEVSASADVQELYRNVKANIDECLAKDPTFVEFYNTVYTAE